MLHSEHHGKQSTTRENNSLDQRRDDRQNRPFASLLPVALPISQRGNKHGAPFVFRRFWGRMTAFHAKLFQQRWRVNPSLGQFSVKLNPSFWCQRLRFKRQAKEFLVRHRSILPSEFLYIRHGDMLSPLSVLFPAPENISSLSLRPFLTSLTNIFEFLAKKSCICGNLP